MEKNQSKILEIFAGVNLIVQGIIAFVNTFVAFTQKDIVTGVINFVLAVLFFLIGALVIYKKYKATKTSFIALSIVYIVAMVVMEIFSFLYKITLRIDGYFFSSLVALFMAYLLDSIDNSANKILRPLYLTPGVVPLVTNIIFTIDQFKLLSFENDAFSALSLALQNFLVQGNIFYYLGLIFIGLILVQKSYDLEFGEDEL